MTNTITAEINNWAKENDFIGLSTASLEELEGAYDDIDEGKRQIKELCSRVEGIVEVELRKIREDMARIESQERLSSQSCRELIWSEVGKENGAVHRLIDKMVQLELRKKNNDATGDVEAVKKDMADFQKKHQQ